MRSGGRHPSSGGPARPPSSRLRPETGNDTALLYMETTNYGFDLNGQSIGNTWTMLPSDIKKEHGQSVTMRPVHDEAAERSPRRWERLHRRSDEDENEKLEKEALHARSAAPRGLSVKAGGASETYPALSATPHGRSVQAGKGAECNTARSAAPAGCP